MVKMLTLGFFVILVASIKCDDYDPDWWKHTTIYEIVPRSFKDSNGDGIGDLNGITSKLDHFVDLGIETLWLLPIFTSPLVDEGYDISDFKGITPMYGTMEDFDNLIKEMKKRNLKLILDFVPNHTSDQHIWFQKSIKRENPYSDYYIWKDPKTYEEDGTPTLPNNWNSIMGGSAWEWNDERQQYYYHAFRKQQPDLNFRNPAVIEEMKSVLRFWLEKGVDGFRADAVQNLVEDKYFRHETWSGEGLLEGKRQQNQPETYLVLSELREFIEKEFVEKDGKVRLFLPEVYVNINYTMLYYDNENYKLAQYPFNTMFVNHWEFPSSMYINRNIRRWLSNMPKGATPNWSFDNHDNRRQVNINGESVTDVNNILSLMLPGVSCLYYGNEIGLSGPYISSESGVDLGGRFGSRDPQRCPMQWDDSKQAGFSEGNKTFLPLNTDYWYRNVKSQKGIENSHYNILKKLLKIKKSKTCRDGDFRSFVYSYTGYAFTRSLPEHPMYTVILNSGRKNENFDLTLILPKEKLSLEIAVGSENSGYRTGEQIVLKNGQITLRPRSAIVVTERKQKEAK